MPWMRGMLRSLIAALDIVEANIAAFNRGQAPDGWSTEPVATLATRICAADMTSFHVVP